MFESPTTGKIINNKISLSVLYYTVHREKNNVQFKMAQSQVGLTVAIAGINQKFGVSATREEGAAISVLG